jgi:hypothetical protein
MASRRNQNQGGGEGRPLECDVWFPDDPTSQELWLKTYKPLAKKSNKILLDGVVLPPDLRVPTYQGARPWRGFRGDLNYQQVSLYYHLWCIISSISLVSAFSHVPYIISHNEAVASLREFGIDPDQYRGGPRKVRAAIYQYIQRRPDIIKSNGFQKLMLDEYHIGHHTFRYYYPKEGLPTDVRENREKASLDSDTILNEYQQRILQIGDTELICLGKRRVGQEIFREWLIKYWSGACAVSGLKCQMLLRASHAKPWKDCASDEERLDVFNGFLLSPQFDALFDSGLMTFDDSGEARFSTQLSQDDRNLIGIAGNCRLRTKPDSRHLPFLEWHRMNVFIP